MDFRELRDELIQSSEETQARTDHRSGLGQVLAPLTDLWTRIKAAAGGGPQPNGGSAAAAEPETPVRSPGAAAGRPESAAASGAAPRSRATAGAGARPRARAAPGTVTKRRAKAAPGIGARIKIGSVTLDDILAKIQATPLARSWRLSSLRTRLIVPYVLLTLILAMLGTFIVTRLVTSSIRERFVNQLFEASRVAADGIVRQERTHLDNLRLMAFTSGVSEATARRDAATLQNLIWPLVLNNDVEAVTIVDTQGQEILSLTRDPKTSQYVFAQGTDLSSLKLVSEVLKGRTDSVGDKYISLTPTVQGPYLFTSAPIRDPAGRLVGALIVGTRLESLLGEIKTQALANVVVLNLDGKLVSATVPTPEEGNQALELGIQQIAELNPSGINELTLNEREYQAVYAPLVIRRQEVGILGVLLPSNFIVTTGATSRNWFSFIFAVGTVAMMVLGYVLAQSIARPILRLRAVSQAVAAGDLEQSTGFRQSDEIGDLAGAFDIMTSRLRERTEEAARLYEETVQRNKELAQINAQLRAAQQQLVQSEKLAAVGQLTAGIVHDVKNPLTVIIGMAEELGEEPNLNPLVQQYLKTMRDSALRANTIVTDLLKFARQSTPEFKRQDVRETIETALRLTEYLARKGNVRVVKELPTADVPVMYDATQLEQVLINLIQNAIQAMPKGGTLRVGLSLVKDVIGVSVQDTGVGIPEKNLHRIFDPFFTTKPAGEGTGLGLSVSFGIVSRHGGHIDVKSTLGKGTTFMIWLPVTHAAAFETSPAA